MIKSLLLTILLASALLASPYCDGWKAGYKAGYCYNKHGCLAPIAPLCPLPELGKDKYLDGYNRGFLAGLASR